jgi:hypothetical protein
MSKLKNLRPSRRPIAPEKMALLSVCIGVMCCAGCVTQKPPSTHYAPLAFTHPILPPPIPATSVGPAPDIALDFDPPPKLVVPRNSPPRPRVVQTAPAEPIVAEKPADPVIVPDLSTEQMNTAKSETEHSLEIAEWNLSQTRGKKLSSAQEDVASKIRGFMDTAKDAIKNSDWGRAKNLAKKAEVLSHELVANL